MKVLEKSIIAVVLLLVSCSGFTGKQRVPALVKNAFYTEFPAVKKVQWVKSDSLYEVSFERNSKPSKAIITERGILKLHKRSIYEFELPTSVRLAIKNNFLGGRIDKAEIVKQGKSKFYQVKINQTYDEIYKVYKSTGKEYRGHDFWD